MQEVGLTEISPLIRTSVILGQDPAFLHPESPQGAQFGVATVVDGLMAATSFVTDRAGASFSPQSEVTEEGAVRENEAM